MKAALIKKKNEWYEKHPNIGCCAALILAIMSTTIMVTIIAISLFANDIIDSITFAKTLFVILVLCLAVYIIDRYSTRDTKDIEEIQLIELQLKEVDQIENVQKICEKYKLKLVSL